MPDFEGQVGSGKAGVTDGSTIPIRLGKTGEIIIGEAHPRFFEQTSRGNTWTASVPVAGVAHGTAYGTTTPITLWNPTGSGVICVLRRYSFAYVSGTLGAGFIGYGQNAQGAAAPAGTEIVPVCGLIGKTSKPSCRAFTGANASGATPTHVMDGPTYGAYAGGATSIGLPVIDELEGMICVLPGNLIAAQGIGSAGTTPLLTMYFVWNEIPLT